MRHLVIPDTQIKPGVPIDHLGWAGAYAAESKPDKIICIGDWFDMCSLSSYDKGKKSFEGRRYKDDIAAGRLAMRLFMEPIAAERARLARGHRERWNPEFHFFCGNHENRILRAIEAEPILEGVIGYHDFNLEEHGWEVHPFLEVKVLDGIAYSHYFTSGVMGRPVTNAKLMLQKKHMSCVMGHVQMKDIAYAYRADGRSMIGIFLGTFYLHDEDYLGPQGNNAWRGVWTLNDVRDGEAEEMPISMNYLRRTYGS